MTRGRRGKGRPVGCQTFSFFPCSADHEQDWPPCKVVFFGLATNALNVRNNNNNNNNRGNYYYHFSLRPRKTQRVNSTTPRSRRFLESFPKEACFFGVSAQSGARLLLCDGAGGGSTQPHRDQDDSFNAFQSEACFLQRLPNQSPVYYLRQYRQWHEEVLYLQPVIRPNRFDIFPP